MVWIQRGFSSSILGTINPGKYDLLQKIMDQTEFRFGNHIVVTFRNPNEKVPTHSQIDP